MSLYYFRVEEGNGQDTSVHISANKEKLKDTRKSVKNEMKGIESVTVEEISEVSQNWTSFSSVSHITIMDSMDKGGQTLYAYTVDYREDGIVNVATNKEDIEALHHDDKIAASEDERQNKEVGEIQELGSEIAIDSPTYIE